MDFLIAIPQKEFPTSHQSLSYQIIIKPNDFGAYEPQELYNNNLWISISSKDTGYVWCRHFIESIEKLTDGTIEKGYLVTGSLEHSSYYCRIGDNQDELKIPEDLQNKLQTNSGMIALSNDDQILLEDVASVVNEVKIVYPDLKKLKGIPRTFSKLPPLFLFNALVRFAKRSFTHQDLYNCSKYPAEWTAYEGLAFRYFEVKRHEDLNIIEEYLEIRYSDEGIDVSLPTRRVELTFTQIDPDNIHTRKFISPPNLKSKEDMLESIIKTGRAEAWHQRTLTELSKRVLSIGLIPLESTSVDLLVKQKNQSILVEIKSATPENFYKQCTRGAIQVLEYCHSIEMEWGTKVRPVVVIEKIGASEIEDYCVSLLRYINVDMILYDTDTEIYRTEFDSLLTTTN